MIPSALVLSHGAFAPAYWLNRMPFVAGRYETAGTLAGVNDGAAGVKVTPFVLLPSPLQTTSAKSCTTFVCSAVTAFTFTAVPTTVME